MDMAMHRYSTYEFSKLAVTQRRTKWGAAVSLLVALGVLSATFSKTSGCSDSQRD
jgi:hypothetical protein